MESDIRRSEPGGNTAYLNVGAWFNPEAAHIHLTLSHSDWFYTTVAPDRISKRGRPNLFSKLAKALREAGVSASIQTDGFRDE